MSNLVIIKDNQAMTTSRMVAATFEKRHDNVLRDVKSLECSAEFNQLNFERVNYIDVKGEQRLEYNITRDGFTFLAMGYTGKKAAQFKEAYIKAFNEMEAAIKSPVALENKYTIEDLIIAQATSIKELKEEVQAMQESMMAAMPVVEPLQLPVGQAELFPVDKLISIAEFNKGKSYNNNMMSYLGRLATRYATANKLRIEKRKNGNLYPARAIEMAISIAVTKGALKSQIPTLAKISVKTEQSKVIDKIISQLKKNPLAQELKGIEVGNTKSYRAYMASTLKNVIYLKIHKCSTLRYSINNSSRGWLKVTRIS